MVRKDMTHWLQQADEALEYVPDGGASLPVGVPPMTPADVARAGAALQQGGVSAQALGEAMHQAGAAFRALGAALPGDLEEEEADG